jgi:hypothetical protein
MGCHVGPNNPGEAATERIELTLHPYEATVVVLSDEPVTMVSADARGERRVPLSGRWQVAYGSQPASTCRTFVRKSPAGSRG